ncbi:MAG: hypothetical protein ACKVWR_15815 [Acidimicrobiales bacterium]
MSDPEAAQADQLEQSRPVEGPEPSPPEELGERSARAAEADVLDQERVAYPSEPTAVRRGAGRAPASLSDEAPEADALEQAIDVGGDDDRRG